MTKIGYLLLVIVAARGTCAGDDVFAKSMDQVAKVMPELIAVSWATYQKNHPLSPPPPRPTYELRAGAMKPPMVAAGKVVLTKAYVVNLMELGAALGHDAYTQELGTFPAATDDVPEVFNNSALLHQIPPSGPGLQTLAVNSFALDCREKDDDCKTLFAAGISSPLLFVVAHELAHLYNRDSPDVNRHLEQEIRADAFATEVLEAERMMEQRGSVGRAIDTIAAEAPLLVLDFERSMAGSEATAKELEERRQRLEQRLSEPQRERVSIFQPLATTRLQPLKIDVQQRIDWIIIDGVRTGPEVIGKELLLPRARHVVAAGAENALAYRAVGEDEMSVSLDLHPLKNPTVDEVHQSAASGNWFDVLLHTADRNLQCKSAAVALEHWQALHHLDLDGAVDVSLLGVKGSEARDKKELEEYVQRNGRLGTNPLVLANYKKAAQSGDQLAQLALGMLYQTGGEIVPQNAAESARWLRMAADQGNSNAQVNLAELYARGAADLPLDVREMLKWATRAAESGNVIAQFNLGVMYDHGQGTTADPLRALAWYKLAADQGYRLAPYNISLLYRTGRGVAHDEAEAVRWALIGANRDDHSAQYAVGQHYEEGSGVPKDEVLAYQWFLIAANNGYEGARQRADRLEKRLSEAERDKANDAMRAWFMKNQENDPR